jgi:uncharacterized membrane protein HdeD (DUF308 family)
VPCTVAALSIFGKIFGKQRDPKELLNVRLTWNVIAALLILTGGIFTLQGMNVLLGSFMSGSSLWLVIGVLMVVVGAALLVGANRNRK